MLWVRSFWHRHWRAVILVLAIVVVGLATGWRTGWLGRAGYLAQTDQPGFYKIAYYVDGDTVDVNMGGHTESVRFIGIDTPETHKPDTPVQCYGPQAAAHTQAAIKAQGGQVRLVSDPLSTNRDRYGRLLRYVYLPDGSDLNELNIRGGYAFYYPYFPFSNRDRFAADEKQAQAARRGLWSHCTPTPTDDGGYKMDEPATSS